MDDPWLPAFKIKQIFLSTNLDCLLTLEQVSSRTPFSLTLGTYFVLLGLLELGSWKEADHRKDQAMIFVIVVQSLSRV